MNRTWQVTYTLYEDSSMTFSKPGMFSMKMNVLADSYSQACQISANTQSIPIEIMNRGVIIIYQNDIYLALKN